MYRSAPTVVFSFRCCQTLSIVKKVIGRSAFITIKVITGAVKFICSALNRHIDGRTSSEAILRVKTIGVYFEFLNCVHSGRWVRSYSARNDAHWLSSAAGRPEYGGGSNGLVTSRGLHDTIRT